MQSVRLAVHFDSNGSPLITAVAYVDRLMVFRHDTNQTVDQSTIQSTTQSIPSCKVEHEDDSTDGGDEEVDQSGNQPVNQSAQAIRILSFSTDGKLLAIGGDDRKVSIYDTTISQSSLQCVAVFTVHRRASVGCFIDGSSDGLIDGFQTYQVMISDKTGDIYCLKINMPLDASTNKPIELSAKIALGHLSTITQISFAKSLNQSTTQSVKGHLLTSDSDGKVRVSRFPNTFVIDSFCLADTSFVSCFECIHDPSASQSNDDNNQSVVLVGGVGNIVRLFERATGKRLSEFSLPHECDFVSSIKYDPSTKQSIITAYPSKHIYVYQLEQPNHSMKLIHTIDTQSPVSSVVAQHGAIIYVDEQQSINHVKFNQSTSSYEPQSNEALTTESAKIFTPALDTVPQSVAGLLYQRRQDLAHRQQQIEKAKAEKQWKRQKKGTTTQEQVEEDKDEQVE